MPQPVRAASDLMLLPTPASVRFTGGEAALDEPLRRVVRDSGLICSTPNHPELRIVVEPGHEAAGGGSERSPERYTLTISQGSPKVRIEAGAQAGFTQALRTLAQLLVRFPDSPLPALVITDHPAFAVRGVMLDVSRNKIPTMASLEQTIDLLASLKFNHLQLYTEHTFAYAGHEEAWRGTDPITPDQARELDAYCSARGIDLAPNQNCFGHLSSWLRLPKYAHLAETHGAWKFLDFDRSGPFSLCPIDDRSEAFVRDLLGQLVPCFRSGLVNIGCDETFDVGFGRSGAEVDKRGRPAVYFEFVNKIASITRSLNKRPMLWADIALNHPESLGMFPPGAVGLAWGYEPDAPFADWCARLREHGIESWVCPGTSSWRSITGRASVRNANLAAAAEQGVAGGAAGYLVTDWGDSGHHQHWPVALAAIARGAQAAWNPAGEGGLVRFDARAASLHAFGDRAWDRSLSIGPWLDALGDIDRPIREANRIRNSSALFNDLHRGYGAKPIASSVQQWQEVGERLERLAASCPSPDDVGELVGAELAHTIETARLAVDHAIAARRENGMSDEDQAALSTAVQRVLREHRRLWTMRNRTGELALSCAHYEKLLTRLGAADPSRTAKAGGAA